MLSATKNCLPLERTTNRSLAKTPYKTLVAVSGIDQDLFKTEDAAACKNYWDKVFVFNNTGEDIHNAIAGKAGTLDAKSRWDSVSDLQRSLCHSGFVCLTAVLFFPDCCIVFPRWP